MSRALEIKAESWPLHSTFTISRGSKTAADVVVAAISEDGHTGYGECVPYLRYGESSGSVCDEIEARRTVLENGLSRPDLQSAMPPGAARNAVDCALWDLEAKIFGKTLSRYRDQSPPAPVLTAQTVSLDSVENMANAAAKIGDGLIKIKVGADSATSSILAVRKAAPKAKIIVDANEAWSIAQLGELMPMLVEAHISLIEQPLPQSDDGALADFCSPIPICADESCHSLAGVDRLEQLYDAINIKLDKTGGLTEAMALKNAAEERGLIVMLGCMVSTSLSIAPVYQLAEGARFIDIDGPLWLKEDRKGGCRLDGNLLHPPTADFMVVPC